MRLPKEAYCARRDTLDQRVEEELCYSPDLDDDAGGRVPPLVPADLDSDSDSSNDDSTVGGDNVGDVLNAPEGAHIVPPEGDNAVPLVPPTQPAPQAPPAAPNIPRNNLSHSQPR